MRRNQVSLLLVLFISIVFASCQKEVDGTLPPDGTNNGGNTGGNNNGGNGGTPTTSNGSYYPLTKDSWWKYKDSLTGNISNGKAVAKTKTVSGITFTAIVPVSTPSTDTAWFAAPSPNYYLYGSGISPQGASFAILFHYLNDTAAVGHSWKYNAGNGNGFTAYITTTIVEKLSSMTVQGKTYKDVIHTRLDLSYDVFGSELDMGAYDYFTAKGVGIIKIRSGLSFMGQTLIETSTDLIDYSIK